MGTKISDDVKIPELIKEDRLADELKRGSAIMLAYKLRGLVHQYKIDNVIRLMSLVNELPGADVVVGYFLQGMCVPTTRDNLGALGIKAAKSPIPDDTEIVLGKGPRILRCQVTFDPDLRSHCPKSVLDIASASIQTIFWFSGDLNAGLPEGYYLRVSCQNHLSRIEILVLRDSNTFLDPQIVPIKQLGHSTKFAHSEMVKVFESAFQVDRSRSDYYV